MQRRLLEEMVCPYCGGRFRISRPVDVDDERVRYGLVECRCFAFPVVDGVLLLSLAKGYGGAEEALQPYVPLQVAAIQHLAADDIDGLRAWIRRHAPLVADLIDGTNETYLELWARLRSELSAHVDAYLEGYGKYEVVGTPKRTVADALRHRLKPGGPPALPTPSDFYPARFSSPRVNALGLQLSALPPAKRVLSLCCGHGVFENLLAAMGHRGQTVSIDGQLLNLLITRRFAGHDGNYGNYICHDVQFPLPFQSEAFDGVFSSTCLPEIPTQQTFAAEATRVTSNQGWTVFDSIWNTEVFGVERVDPLRHYRFAQNFFADLAEYLPMFEACAGPSRRVGVDVPDVPAAYLDGPRWQFGADVDKALAGRSDDLISVVVLGSGFPGFGEPNATFVGAGPLAVSLAFDTSAAATHIDLVRRPEFESLPPLFAPRRLGGYPETARVDLGRTDDPAYLTDLYTAATVTLAPPDFTDDGTRLLPARRGPEASGTSSRPGAGGAGG